MKINGQTVVGKSFAYDGCHKIYVIETLEEMEEALETGYSILSIDQLEQTYENSCSLRFISNWALTKRYVGQFDEEVEFEIEEEV